MLLPFRFLLLGPPCPCTGVITTPVPSATPAVKVGPVQVRRDSRPGSLTERATSAAARQLPRSNRARCMASRGYAEQAASPPVTWESQPSPALLAGHPRRRNISTSHALLCPPLSFPVDQKLHSHLETSLPGIRIQLQHGVCGSSGAGRSCRRWSCSRWCASSAISRAHTARPFGKPSHQGDMLLSQ